MSKERNKHDKNHERASDSQKTTYHHDIKWPSVYPIKMETTADDEKKYAEQKDHRGSQLRIAKWLNGITSVGTAAALIGLGFLWGTLKAGNRSIDAQTKAMIIDERAWVFPNATAWAFANNGTNAVASIGFRNTGKTPAFNVHGWYCAQIRDSEPPENDYPTQFCEYHTAGVVGPNVPFNVQRLDHQTIVNDGIRKRIANKELRFYFWGRVDYDDFSNEHGYTSFCLRSETNGKDFSGSSSGELDRMGSCQNNTGDAR